MAYLSILNSWCISHDVRCAEFQLIRRLEMLNPLGSAAAGKPLNVFIRSTANFADLWPRREVLTAKRLSPRAQRVHNIW